MSAELRLIDQAEADRLFRERTNPEAEGPVHFGRDAGFGYSRSDAVLFGQLSFDGADDFVAAFNF